MNKEEKQTFFDLGKKDYAKGVPCRPFQSEELMKGLFQDGLKNVSPHQRRSASEPLCCSW